MEAEPQCGLGTRLGLRACECVCVCAHVPLCVKCLGGSLPTHWCVLSPRGVPWGGHGIGMGWGEGGCLTLRSLGSVTSGWKPLGRCVSAGLSAVGFLGIATQGLACEEVTEVSMSWTPVSDPGPCCISGVMCV